MNLFAPRESLAQFLRIITIVIILYSFFMIVFCIYQLSQNEKFWMLNPDEHQKPYAIATLIFTIFLGIQSSIQQYSIIKKQVKPLVLSLITAIILFLSFIILTIIGGVVLSNVFEGKKCEDVVWLEQIQQLSIQASNEFCKQNCQCYIKNPEMFTNETLENLNFEKNSDNLPVRFQQCEEQDDQQLILSKVLQDLEHEYNCSGFCKKQDILMFSNVNNSAKMGISCFQALDLEYHQFGNNVFAFNLLSVVILFLNFLIIFCIIQHPKRTSCNFMKKLAIFDIFQKQQNDEEEQLTNQDSLSLQEQFKDTNSE